MVYGMIEVMILLFVLILTLIGQEVWMIEKSPIGGVFFLGGRLVSWLKKKQDYISQSTIEVDYIASENNYNQVMWMKQMLKDIGITFEEPIIIKCDKTSIVSMSKNHVLQSKTKHISIKYHVLREKAVEKEIRLKYVNTKENI